MKRFTAILGEIYGLVVDDGILALAVLVLTGAVWLLVSRLGMSPAIGSGILFVGLAAILVESATRRARR